MWLLALVTGDTQVSDFFLFFPPAKLVWIFWYWCYYPHTSRDSESLVDRIFILVLWVIYLHV